MSRLNLAVEEFTTPAPITARESASLNDLRSLMNQHQVRHIPIVSGETVVGLVSDRDLRLVAGLAQSERDQVCARDIMSPDPVTMSGGASLEKVVFEMSEKKIGSVIINDENDQFLGIFTVIDALNALVEIVRATPNGRS
ncbi:MAG: CBS domain-containing protein [Bdellovibrionales bacterium]